MALLWITEYAEIGYERAGHTVPAPKEPALAYQTVDFTAGETKSAAFDEGTRYVLLTSDTNCSVRFGADPTAVTAQPTRIWSKMYAAFVVDKLAGMKVSVIT
ncbi:MAG: hypothetical protein ACR2OV_15905 [Hyphomicrobiaceae bacterium]